MADSIDLLRVLNVSTVGIMVMQAVRDDSGHIIDFVFVVVNWQAVAPTPYTVDDLLGKRLLDVSPNMKVIGFFDAYVRVVETGEPFDTEFFYDHDGIYGWFFLSIRKLDDGFVATIQDITQRKQLEQQTLERERFIAQFRTELEHTRLIQQALAALVNDIRQPISIITLSKDVLLHYYDKLSELKRREKLDSIGEQLDYTLKRIDSTLALIHRMLNERPFTPRRINIQQVCEMCIEQIGQMYGANAAQQIRLINTDNLQYIIADDVLISRILMNLLSNAVKYSRPDEYIFLEIVHDKPKNQLILRVVDSGIGIPDEHLPHICEPFYRVRPNDHLRGAGLGLSIVKECVERHGGKLSITSKLDSGTVVVVRLPFVAAT